VIGPRIVAVSVALGTAVLIATASAAGAQGANGRGPGGSGPPGLQVAATPELDSALLFGTGLLSIASYGALRWRARRK
jgi:hypothetical protein